MKQSHVAFIPFTGLRVRETELLQFGMTLPGLGTRAGALSELPALGVLTLAGMMPEDWTCSYHPSSASDDLVAEVLATNPTIVGVSALTASVQEAYAFCKTIKANGVPVVIGGLHATALPDEAKRYASSVCVKDGESSWLQILQDVKADRLKPQYTPSTPFTLAESPLPRFDLIPSQAVSRWTMQTQRGCPWACEFCAASRLLGPPRFKPVERIDMELRAIRGHDTTPWVELADDNTFASRPDSDRLVESLGAANIRYFTESDWNIAERPDFIKRLAESGCMQVLMGIESLAFQYSGMGRKRAELDQMNDRIEMIQDAGIVVNGCFIVGAADETDESLDRLVEFVNASSLAEVQITLQTPFPGTALYRKLNREKRLLVDRDWSHYTLFDVVYQPEKLSVAELERGFRRTMSAVFCESQSRLRSASRRRIWSKHPRMGRTND